MPCYFLNAGEGVDDNKEEEDSSDAEQEDGSDDDDDEEEDGASDDEKDGEDRSEGDVEEKEDTKGQKTPGKKPLTGGDLMGLVLAPTRELAVQVKNHLVAAAKYTGIKVCVLVNFIRVMYFVYRVYSINGCTYCILDFIYLMSTVNLG